MKGYAQGLRVLLLPVSSDPDPWDLLLPAAAVAELVRVESAGEPGPGAPDWLRGYLDWRGLRLPLVRPTPVTGSAGRAYAAVCFSPGGGESAARFFAIESPGMPRLERVTPEGLSAETGHPAAAESPFIQVALRVQGRSAGLVNLDVLQRALRALAG